MMKWFLVFLLSGALYGEPLASWSASGGRGPHGGIFRGINIDSSGKLEATDTTLDPAKSHFTAHLSAGELHDLRIAVKSWQPSSWKPDGKAIPPSAHDSADEVIKLWQHKKNYQLNLWEVPDSKNIPVVARLRSLSQKYLEQRK